MHSTRSLGNEGMVGWPRNLQKVISDRITVNKQMQLNDSRELLLWLIHYWTLLTKTLLWVMGWVDTVDPSCTYRKYKHTGPVGECCPILVVFLGTKTINKLAVTRVHSNKTNTEYQQIYHQLIVSSALCKCQGFSIRGLCSFSPLCPQRSTFYALLL